MHVDCTPLLAALAHRPPEAHDQAAAWKQPLPLVPLIQSRPEQSSYLGSWHFYHVCQHQQGLTDLARSPFPCSCRPPEDDEEAALESVSGDSWGAVLRRTADGAPLAGASVLVFGADHARLQVGALLKYRSLIRNTDSMCWQGGALCGTFLVALTSNELY
jgi:hypothetical protein